eukprot:640291-Rhodomonas_salina.2
MGVWVGELGITLKQPVNKYRTCSAVARSWSRPQSSDILVEPEKLDQQRCAMCVTQTICTARLVYCIRFRTHPPLTPHTSEN